MEEELNNAFSKCTCRETKWPPILRKIPFSRVFSEFNYLVQVDYISVMKLSSSLVLRRLNVATFFFARTALSSRHMLVVTRSFKAALINAHGPPIKVFENAKFFNTTFNKTLDYLNVLFESRPAIRLSKLGSAER